MAVWYLDNDDEITDAVARLRGASDEHIVFVVPPGSRIATGRINFKILAREAESRAKELAVASPDEQVRALATSAGVLAAPTADEAAAALERGDPPPVPGTAADVVPGDEEPASLEPQPAGRSALLVWRSQRVRVVTVIVLVIAIVGGYVGLETLPTAELTLSPRITALGPVEASVTATAAVASPDPAEGRIPAVELAFPLDVAGTFEASGAETIETRATGVVVFSSPGQLADQVIAKDTPLQTPSRVEFRTTEAVTLPRSTGTISSVTARVEAIAPGEEGNVEPGTISIVESLEGQGISVSNPRPLTGGRIEETPRVTSADYDRAAAILENRLEGAGQVLLRDPANVPEGLTLFPETLKLRPFTYDPPFDALVGRGEAEFSLAGTATARVLAVDERLVDEVTQARLQDAIPSGEVLLDDSAAVTHQEGIVEGDHVRFEGVGSAATYPLVDADELGAQVAGLPISEARAILERFGTATVSVWPDFLGDLPDDRQRITLEVTEPSTTE